MKTTLLTSLCSIALALTVFGQTPTPPASPSATAVASTSTSATVSPSVSPAATPDDEDSIERSVTRKLERRLNKRSKRHVNITSNGHDGDFDFDEGALMAIPIVGIIFTTLFGAPVMVVAAIMFFSYLKSRSLHRTVREMVAKGQEVPAALFAPPPVVRARSDMRKGIVLTMVGVGVMLFFAAVNEWEGGAWALGIIPFLIGLGYLLVWKLEGAKDKVPPLP